MPEATRMTVHGIELEVMRCGAGQPIVLLHGLQPCDPEARFVRLLSQRAEVIAPSYPGFGRSARPKDFESVYDLANLQAAVLDALPYDRVTLIGFSFGGWLAAELAVRGGAKIERLVLVDAVGIKISDRETADITDVFNTHPEEVKRRTWHDLANAPDFDAMSDEALVMRHRNWESLSLYAWHPYMHNPRLAYWLGRIAVPTLVLWGASDGIVSPTYGQAFAARIPAARFALIERAGHQPEIEQPDVFVDHVSAFLNS
ncbi:alpha/beta fold hydrolase [Rhodopila sp.]|uniref:alpha/beta fold hydrolase n=1 Tax=Rhodopila sp. TaxID=2480087 RepID=UPI003D14BCA4